jgi:hypothetical protein
MRGRALRFADHSGYLAALALLDLLADTGPIEYQPVGEDAALMPEWVHRQLTPLLKDKGVPFQEVEVVPMSDLPPKEQARLRGLRRGSGTRRRGLAR